MRLIAKLKLTEPNVANEIALAGKMRAVFTKAHEVPVDIDSYAVFADDADPYTAMVEVTLKNADDFINAIQQEKHFDFIYKFFDIMKGNVIKQWLNYIETMCLFEDNIAYEMPEYCLTMPTAEDACVELNAELDCEEADVSDADIVAIWIRRDNCQTDIVLPIYMRNITVTTNNTVEISADTYDESSERLSPDVYRPVLDVIDSLTKLKSPCHMLAIDSYACCGDEIDISETVYPIRTLCLNFSRRGKEYSIILNNN